LLFKNLYSYERRKMAEIQANDSLPPEVLRQLRRVERKFRDETLPLLKARRHFTSRSEKRREKARTGRPSCKKPAIRFSPFAMTLGNGLLDVRSSVRNSQSARMAIIPAQTGQLISVFIIALIKADPPLYVIQKIQKKSAPGFPGGTIENGETILGTGAREFREESNGGDPTKGVDIAAYNPTCIGKFVLDRAMSGEEGTVVLVEIPESEIANLKTGGGGEEGEVVEYVSLLTFDEVSERAENRTILPNSAKIWDLYCNYLANAP
jgi:hypothetical protein